MWVQTGDAYLAYTRFRGEAGIGTVSFEPTVMTSYGGTITVNSDATSGTNTRSCSGAGVSADQVVTTPTFSPDGGAYAGDIVNVIITCATDGATIRYTTDGNDPTESSPTVASGGTVSVPVPGTLKAKAWKTGMNPSGTKTANYIRKQAGDLSKYQVPNISISRPLNFWRSML